VAELTLVEAINDCFHVELERDENVLVMGDLVVHGVHPFVLPAPVVEKLALVHDLAGRP